MENSRGVGLLALAKTTEAVVVKLNSSVNQALLQSGEKELFAKVDLTQAGNTPAASKKRSSPG